MVAQIDKEYLRTRPTRLWSRMLSYALFEGRPITTRGRWFNPLIFSHLSLWKKLPQLKAVKAPIFILGTGRSGTTILGIVLSMHRDVGFLNEPKAIWASLLENEDLIGSYNRDQAMYRLDISYATSIVSKNIKHIYGAYLRTTFCGRVVDKYPEMIFRVPFLKAIFPDARFLFLSRDGWDTCASIDNWSHRLGKEVEGEQHDWWGVNRRKWNLLVEQIVVEHPDLAGHQKELAVLQDHRLMAAVEWIVTMREGMRLLQEYPADVLHVPYNQLCEAPCEMAKGIIEFCGLADDPVYLRYAQNVLSPPMQKPSFQLPDYLKGAFESTQMLLGHVR